MSYGHSPIVVDETGVQRVVIQQKRNQTAQQADVIHAASLWWLGGQRIVCKCGGEHSAVWLVAQSPRATPDRTAASCNVAVSRRDCPTAVGNGAGAFKGVEICWIIYGWRRAERAHYIFLGVRRASCGIRKFSGFPAETREGYRWPDHQGCKIRLPVCTTRTHATRTSQVKRYTGMGFKRGEKNYTLVRAWKDRDFYLSEVGDAALVANSVFPKSRPFKWLKQTLPDRPCAFSVYFFASYGARFSRTGPDWMKSKLIKSPLGQVAW